jgi:hypothetical protein
MDRASTLTRQLEEARETALEEAAKVAETIKERGQEDFISAPVDYLDGHEGACHDIAAAIRSLKQGERE